MFQTLRQNALDQRSLNGDAHCAGQGLLAELPLACPRCKGPLCKPGQRYLCERCGSDYPQFAGLADFRLRDFDSRNQKELAERFVREWDTLTYEDMIRLRYSGLRERAISAGRDPSGFGAWTADERAHLSSYKSRGRRHRRILRGMIEEVRGLTAPELLLDVGCGWGRDLLHLAGLAKIAVGVDISTFSLLMTKKLLAESGVTNVRLLLAQGEHLPFRSEAVDGINSSATIEHFPDPGAFLREASRCLKGKGWLFLYYPNRFSILPETHTLIPFLGWHSREEQRAIVARKTGLDWSTNLFSRHEFLLLLGRTFRADRRLVTGVPGGIEQFMLTSKFCAGSSLRRKAVAAGLRIARNVPLGDEIASFVAPVHFVAARKGRSARRETAAPTSSGEPGVDRHNDTSLKDSSGVARGASHEGAGGPV